MDRFINNENHWWERAKEMRAPAERIDHVEAKRTMLEIAENYDHLVVAPKSTRLSTKLKLRCYAKLD